MTDRETPAKPYLLRALYEWCTDNGYTPHVTVRASDDCQVPRAHVRNGQITLNIGALATHNLQMGNEFIEFQARFNGVPEHVSVPVGMVLALYARETGAGMGFEIEAPETRETGSALASLAAARPADQRAPDGTGTGEAAPALSVEEPERPVFRLVK